MSVWSPSQARKGGRALPTSTPIPTDWEEGPSNLKGCTAAVQNAG